ncbi:MAG: hypothetical protein AVDCRST_MAG59-3728 [uncultured Thermomicrobiales bacterium]|uniref:Uncharacterized protein n=1 Tax=uncultured Thermomicrobiales bacterium TaxID=1645740 RepID=A0A6J4VBW7_9BACT|nr:MAG: hypothetical protein AVDCRST_MAG59-3728 [uncultured Thermomicrobiales bacterium]
MPTVEALRCPVCGAPLAGPSPRCASCGSLVELRTDHPPLDPALLDSEVVQARIDAFRRRLRQDGQDVEARYGLGLAYVGLGLLEDAARELEAVARLTPEDTRIQTQLAVVLADLAANGKRGAEREALERVDLALRLNPDEPEALLLAARLQEARGDWRAAADTLRRAAGVGSLGVDRRAALSLMALAATLAQRGQWLDAASLWEKAVAADPEAAREPLMAILREHQRTLLSRPRWSWLVYPQTSPFERKVRYAAAIAFSALAALAAFVLLSGNDATLAFSLVPCLLVVVAPVAIVLQGRRRLRERSVPQAEVARAIRADPASFFRGRPHTTKLLAAAEYVAAEMQGAAIAGAHPWVSGRTSPSSRRAWRAASVRAPWLPDGDGDRR